MENYINLNGNKIELTSEQITKIQKSFGISNVKLSDIPVEDTCKLGKYEFIVLDRTDDETLIVLKDLLFENEEFGEKNNYSCSNVDKLCCEFAKEIADIVGEENIVEHTVDLTSNDGLKDYGAIKRKMSLVTADIYRKYVYIFDKYKLDKWWWLATAFSTPAHDDECYALCVSPSGGILYYDYYVNDIGVRPFCILKSNIFVSK